MISKLAYTLLVAETMASATANEGYTNTLADCQAFAKKFENTCTSTTAVAFKDVPEVDKVCSEYGSCSTGTEAGGKCTFKRKLCVTCREDANKVVKIRTQTNGRPSHCYKSPNQGPKLMTIDFEVNWLPTGADQATSSPTTQDDVDALVCNIMRSKDTNIPAASEYKLTSDSDNMATAWGVATTGSLLFSSISGEGVDPFYPAKYGKVTDPTTVVEKVDACLQHPQPDGIFHYHSVPLCGPGLTTQEALLSSKTGDVKELIKSAYTKDMPYRTPTGIAKDGRPIYSPLHSNGQEYAPCDVDICNGKMIKGHYAYVTTTFHPFVMGCYGKGSSPALYQRCSTNPRLCGVTYGSAEEDGAITLKGWGSMIAGAFALYTLV